jgi:hypothetical protein
MTKRCPSLSPSFSAASRAVISATPAAPNGRMKRTGRLGYVCCARASCRVASTQTAATETASPSATLRRVSRVAARLLVVFIIRSLFSWIARAGSALDQTISSTTLARTSSSISRQMWST